MDCPRRLGDQHANDQQDVQNATHIQSLSELSALFNQLCAILWINQYFNSGTARLNRIGLAGLGILVQGL